MCRWIVYKGRTVWLCDIVTRPSHGLIKQAYERYMPFIQENTKQSVPRIEVNARINADGFGIGWYSESVYGYSKPCTFHSISPAPNNKNLKILCDHVQTGLLFSHVRASSGSAVAENNCHPFVSGRWMFMHNGAVARFLRVKRKLGQKLSKEVYYAIEGTTDTEYVFALFLDILGQDRETQDVSIEKITDAFVRTIQILVNMTYSVEEPNEPHGYSSLNFALTNGKMVIASRFRDGPEDPPSLYYHNKGYYHCDDSGNVHVPLIDEDTTTPDILIASEPLTLSDDFWYLAPKDSVLVVDEVNRLNIITSIKADKESCKPEDFRWWAD